VLSVIKEFVKNIDTKNADSEPDENREASPNTIGIISK
jgi:hypothetical protein